MSKGKKRRQKGQPLKPKSVLSANVRRRNYSGITKPAPSKKVNTSSSSKGNNSQPVAPQASQRGLSVPFTPAQKILLVGEGDFSFAHSLVTHHKCTRLVATTLESRASLVEKHGRAAGHIGAIEAAGPGGATSKSDNKSNNSNSTPSPPTASSRPGPLSPRVLYNVDATVLCQSPRGGGAGLRRLGPFDRIVFNFPHVGGVTRDVNRQVRANQELCAKFLGAAASPSALAPGGRVVVTLFDGDPYELWGIRNLARHVGLAVDRSANFEWDMYPGYSHARTLGDVRGGGGWKGEDRRARMYVFGRPGEEDRFPKTRKKKKSKGLGSDDSDEESDDSMGDNFSDLGPEDDDDEMDEEVGKSDDEKSGEESES